MTTLRQQTTTARRCNPDQLSPPERTSNDTHGSTNRQARPAVRIGR